VCVCVYDCVFGRQCLGLESEVKEVPLGCIHSPDHQGATPLVVYKSIEKVTLLLS